MKLNQLELATVLHALRAMQNDITTWDTKKSCLREAEHFQGLDVDAITPAFIGNLCETINTQEEEKPAPVLYVVTHDHKYGRSVYLVTADHPPTAEECINALDIDYEERKGESIEIDKAGEILHLENPEYIHLTNSKKAVSL